jgi:hypothetical protein
MMADPRASVLMQPEAERMVQELRLMTLEDVGATAWTKQHQALEKLNMQAQISVMSQGDEFVVEALIDHYVKLYLIMYHEAIVLGLLEKAFFTSTAVIAGGDMLVELADYCYRRTVYLNNVDPNKVRVPRRANTCWVCVRLFAQAFCCLPSCSMRLCGSRKPQRG